MKTNKRELTVFAVCAYAVPFLMMPLLYICLQNGQDTSIFANAQMFYPAAGVMLAFLLARRPDTPLRCRWQTPRLTWPARPWWRWSSWRARRTGRRSRLYRT